MSHRRAQALKPALQENNDMEENESEMAPLSVEEECQKERHILRVRRWKESPFAVGLTESNWMDERSRPLKPTSTYGEADMEPDHSGCLCCSAKVCPMLGASRVGNMIVLRQSQNWTEEEVVDEETGELVKLKVSRPSLDIVVGPYWPMLVFVTYPLILGVSVWTFWGGIRTGAPKPFGKTSLCLVKLRDTELCFVVIFALIVLFCSSADSLGCNVVDLHSRSCRFSCLYGLSRPWYPVKTNNIPRKHVAVVRSGPDLPSSWGVL